MKKLFISQPMKDRSDEEILNERNDIINKVKASLKEDVTAVDSFIKEAPAENNPLWFLGKSLEFMAEADIVVFAKDWESARGCRVEHYAATEYKKEILVC